MPLYNKQKIFTLSLNRLGITEPVDLDSNDVKIAVLNNDYETAIDTLLGEVDWNFARRKKTLSLEKSENGAFYFDIPNDCVKVRCVLSAEPVKKLRFELESKYIITSENAAEVCYTTRHLDENDFTADFVKTLSYSLAASVALTLTESENKLRLMNSIYESCIRKYAAINANESNEVLIEPEYYEVR